MAHPDLAAEQAYVDNAYAALDRTRETLLRSAGAAATEEAAEAIEKWSARRLTALAKAEEGLCFGRIDIEGADAPIYVGRRWVDDEERATLVVNWQAPAARPFYTATPDEPHGVTLRRRFRTRGRDVLDLSDEALDGSSRTRQPPSTTSCSRSSIGRARAACATSSPRSRPTSTGSSHASRSLRS